ncbi:MAG: phosphatase PAP2 family protein [Bdellovibrionaceae bacterium]|nr:phosphatase PAP2 family protein [Pseudobdellovibrionaceae bacterium]
MYLFSSLKPADITQSQLIKYCVRITTGFICLVGLCIVFIDQPLTSQFKDDDWLWLLAREVTHVGLFTNYFIPAFLIWFGAQILLRWKKSKNRQRLKLIATQALWLMYCLLFSGLWTHILKFSFGRQRPKISPLFDPYEFQFFNTHWDFHSLPSGHSQVVFTVATFLAFMFPRFKYGFYSVAFVMGFTRVMTRDHFFSDVLAGLAVGHLSTIIMLFWLYGRHSQNFKT